VRRWSSKYGKINHIINNGKFVLRFYSISACVIVINCSIAGFTFDKMLHTMPDEVYDIIMKVHVRAPFRLIRAAAPYFRVKVLHQIYSLSDYLTNLTCKIKSGTPENRTIINVSSVSGLHGNIGQANYAAAKAAVVGLTKTIAKEWGPFGVRANTIAFGMVHTRYLSCFQPSCCTHHFDFA
jgi:3-oxoacyl-[acyl-carrier protein] reductase